MGKLVRIGVGMVCLLLCFQELSAQKGLRVGIFAQPQWVRLQNPDDAALNEAVFDYEPLAGMAGGVRVGYHFTENLGIQLNVIYSLQGSRYSAQTDGELRNQFTTRLEYIKLPLLLGFQTSSVNTVVFSLYAGVQPSFLTRGYAYDDVRAYGNSIPEDVSGFPTTFGAYEPVYISLVGEIGVDIVLSDEWRVGVHLRPEYGLTDAEDKDRAFQQLVNGNVTSVNYWNWLRGQNNRADTRHVVLGANIGVTYVFGQ